MGILITSLFRIRGKTCNLQPCLLLTNHCPLFYRMIFIPVVEGFFGGIIIGKDLVNSEDPKGLSKDNCIEDYRERYIIKYHNCNRYQYQGTDDYIYVCCLSHTSR